MDDFQYIITPVEIKYTEFDNTNYIFKKNISRKILFYSLAVVKIGVNTYFYILIKFSLKKIKMYYKQF